MQPLLKSPGHLSRKREPLLYTDEGIPHPWLLPKDSSAIVVVAFCRNVSRLQSM